MKDRKVIRDAVTEKDPQTAYHTNKDCVKGEDDEKIHSG
jgi:hypothetical protein